VFVAFVQLITKKNDIDNLVFIEITIFIVKAHINIIKNFECWLNVPMQIMAKCPLAKCPLTKCPLAKCPGLKIIELIDPLHLNYLTKYGIF